MNMNIQKNNPDTIVSFDSSVLQEDIPKFREQLTSLITETTHWIILDMAGSQYLSSMGISVILDVQRRAIKYGGDVYLVNVNYLIRNLFEVTNLLEIIKILPDIDKAHDAIAKRVQSKGEMI